MFSNFVTHSVSDPSGRPVPAATVTYLYECGLVFLLLPGDPPPTASTDTHSPCSIVTVSVQMHFLRLWVGDDPISLQPNVLYIFCNHSGTSLSMLSRPGDGLKSSLQPNH